jgi:hypothetical protein
MRGVGILFNLSTGLGGKVVVMSVDKMEGVLCMSVISTTHGFYQFISLLKYQG